jgi:hypothetical protein
LAGPEQAIPPSANSSRVSTLGKVSLQFTNRSITLNDHRLQSPNVIHPSCSLRAQVPDHVRVQIGRGLDPVLEPGRSGVSVAQAQGQGHRRARRGNERHGEQDKRRGHLTLIG